MKYRQRFLEETIKEAVDRFGAVVVTGPRQSGKTSLIQHVASELFGNNVTTIAFDTPSEIDAFRRDPDLFFSNHPGLLFLDEVQHVPDIFPYLKREIDRHTGSFRFFISGSQHFSLMQGVSESLAGRAAVFDLWPFCALEINAVPRQSAQDLIRLLENPAHIKDFIGQSYPCSDNENLVPLMLSGGYPPSALRNGDRLWLDSYRRTYVDRDVREITTVKDLGRFDRFLTLLAGRSGTTVNKNEMANSLGVDHKTVDQWLDILIASYQMVRIPAYSVNATKRVVKRPKLVMADSGLALLLQGIRDREGLLNAPHFGFLFESFFIMELRKLYGHTTQVWNAHYWRSASGKECDLVLPVAGQLIPIEIKHGTRIRKDDCKGIMAFMSEYGKQVAAGYVVSMHPDVFQIIDKIWHIPLGLFLRKNSEGQSTGTTHHLL
jgi:hypothetical protein